MIFELDPQKSVTNLAKHGLSVTDALSLRGVPGVEVDLGKVNDEHRYARLAPKEGTVYIAIFTFRSTVVRLISARRASTKEIECYERHRNR